MTITETFTAAIRVPDPGDGRWFQFDASPTEVQCNISGRWVPCSVDDLRKVRAIVNHFIEAEEVTEASTLAAIAAEFGE